MDLRELDCEVEEIISDDFGLRGNFGLEDHIHMMKSIGWFISKAEWEFGGYGKRWKATFLRPKPEPFAVDTALPYWYIKD